MSNVLNALGFAQRAGKCTSGETGCDAEFKARRALLIIVDAMASESTRTRWQHRCENAGVSFSVLEGAAEAIGKPGKMVLAISDAGFAKMIRDALVAG